MIRLFALSVFTGFSGAIVPGTLFAVCLQQALLVGWTAGFWLIVGHALVEGVLVLLLRLGVGSVLTRPVVVRAISLIGGLVLLWFAWGMLSMPLPVAEKAEQSPMTAGVLIGQGMLISALHPYVYLWWGTVGIGMIGAQVADRGNRAWPVFYAGHTLSDFLWYGFVSITVALAGSFLSPQIHRGLIVACGIGVTALAMLFLFRALRARPL